MQWLAAHLTQLQQHDQQSTSPAASTQISGDAHAGTGFVPSGEDFPVPVNQRPSLIPSASTSRLTNSGTDRNSHLLQTPERNSLGHSLVSPDSALVFPQHPASEPKSYAPRSRGLGLLTEGTESHYTATGPGGAHPFQSGVESLEFTPSCAAAAQGATHQIQKQLQSLTPQQPNHRHAVSLHAIPENRSLVPFGSFINTVAPAVKQGRSDKLNSLTHTATGAPSFETALMEENFPFIECGKQHSPVNHGCIKLQNIPFSTTRSEVIAFFGRNSRILNDADEPVHIIMERVTSKTMDAYVEFCTLDDAMTAVDRIQKSDRQLRLGDRFIEAELASQSALMKDLFPFATGVRWDGVNPVTEPFDNDRAFGNFKGFVFEEEMIMLVKHVEVPHRSPFSKDCPQRPYESLISTLKKFPWHMTHCITISQRRAIFNATCDLIRLLKRSILRGSDPCTLNDQLLQRLVGAGMRCPGFTALMKDDIAFLVHMGEQQQQQTFGQPRYAHAWRHQWAISPKKNTPLDVVEYYIAVIREQSQRDLLSLPMTQRNELHAKSRDTDMYWGFFWHELAYDMGPQFDQMTLAQAAHIEFSAVERILARALRSYHPQQQQQQHYPNPAVMSSPLFITGGDFCSTAAPAVCV